MDKRPGRHDGRPVLHAAFKVRDSRRNVALRRLPQTSLHPAGQKNHSRSASIPKWTGAAVPPSPLPSRCRWRHRTPGEPHMPRQSSTASIFLVSFFFSLCSVGIRHSLRLRHVPMSSVRSAPSTQQGKYTKSAARVEAHAESFRVGMPWADATATSGHFILVIHSLPLTWKIRESYPSCRTLRTPGAFKTGRPR